MLLHNGLLSGFPSWIRLSLPIYFELGCQNFLQRKYKNKTLLESLFMVLSCLQHFLLSSKIFFQNPWQSYKDHQGLVPLWFLASICAMLSSAFFTCTIMTILLVPQSVLFSCLAALLHLVSSAWKAVMYFFKIFLCLNLPQTLGSSSLTHEDFLHPLPSTATPPRAILFCALYFPNTLCIPET